MLEYSLAHGTSFFAAALLLNLAPGPDIAFIMGHTVNDGKKNGLAAMFVGLACRLPFIEK
ncbi:hypothetical protein [Desulfatibacillum aliphaticivorans]|uniref:hypothetical protein n=1 Tax=Desulfatibacillum aliphaticivorans TaxID=218208 RepID=UPI000424DF1C|nr:hypothetical protein [Desulfatibacillum aliphaticivorans]